MNPIIKWPGGKSGELSRFLPLIPEFDRYIEPFFGGGALFFHLRPERALINDLSSPLMDYYQLVRRQDPELKAHLDAYDASFAALQSIILARQGGLMDLYHTVRDGDLPKKEAAPLAAELVSDLFWRILCAFPTELVLDQKKLFDQLTRMVADKLVRTVKNDRKTPFGAEDLKNNLLTGFASGYYMYFRDVYNDIQLGRRPAPSPQYAAANFYFIREYCYGSMFRYNARGEFNIPYGGMSYNKKRLAPKIESMFHPDTARLFANTDIHCLDFEEFLDRAAPTGDDFIFLDPPYDTDFSDYEGRAFSAGDQRRLAAALGRTRAQFILIIKNTPLIRELYGDRFNVLAFANRYTYNVRSRNDRATEHLIISKGLPVS